MNALQRQARKERMNTHKFFSGFRGAGIALSLAAALAGCKSTSPATDDASLNSKVQGRLASDQNLAGQPIQASVANGVVTLNGTVTSDAARSLASGDAAQIAGVRTVVNNLTVQPPPPVSTPISTTAVTEAPPPLPVEKVRKPSASISRHTQSQPAPIERNNPPAQPAPQQQNPGPVAQVQPPPPPPPPPAPVVHNITLPAGTSIPVRITQSLDSATTQTGDKFTGAVASDIIVDGLVVLPQGTPVTGHVDAAQDATHFKGSSLLTISLNSISRRGERIDVATEPYTRQGEGRGKNTAEKVGGGAAVGAILGGIFGGGKGAAIGAAAGGGVGAGAQGVTRGQQVQIPSETVVRFKLSDSIMVRVTTGGNTSGNSGPTLEHHNE
jgi:hypothetical protein